MLYLEIEQPTTTLRRYEERAFLPVGDSFFVYYPDICDEEFEFAKRVLREIDKSELLSPQTVKSPIIDIMPIYWISNGAKNLIMMHSKLEFIYSLDFMGDNCLPLLFEICSEKDIHATLSMPSRLYTDGLLGPVCLSNQIFTDTDALNTFILNSDLLDDNDTFYEG